MHTIMKGLVMRAVPILWSTLVLRGMAIVCAAAALASAQNDAPISSRQLSRQFNAAHQAKNYERAIDIGEKWTSLKPKDDGAAYNLACAYAMNGDTEDAVKWLNKSVENGWDDAQHIKLDSDLDSIRESPGYAAALATVAEREQAKLDKFIKAVEKAEPVIYAPPGYDAAAPPPLIIALHGRGSVAKEIADAWKQAAANAGAILVAPRAVHGVMSGGARWGTVEQTELIIDKALQNVADSYKYDADRVILTGFSQGGFMTFNLAVRSPERYRGAIPAAGRYEPRLVDVKSLSPSTSPRFYIMVGDADGVLETNRAAANDLQAAGVAVELAVFPGVGHSFPDDHVKELGKAVRFVLAKD